MTVARQLLTNNSEVRKIINKYRRIDAGRNTNVPAQVSCAPHHK